jgi:hypothetical protein
VTSKREDADVPTPLGASAGEAEVEQCMASTDGICGVADSGDHETHIIPPKIV